uniref:B30.2/SPRY domain-containing protein n=1 Tax=Globodera rostochiensis TaxID=31243 RepID=A0A914I9U5_GLORO
MPTTILWLPLLTLFADNANANSHICFTQMPTTILWHPLPTLFVDNANAIICFTHILSQRLKPASKMRFFHFLDAVCLFVVAAFILLETDAAPKTSTSNTKLKNEPAKQKNPGLTPENEWNSKSNACHPHLTLSVPKRLLVVKHNEKKSMWSSVFAVKPIPKTSSGTFYYEVTILGKECMVAIGLCTKPMPLDKEIGELKGTYAYQSCGMFSTGPDEQNKLLKSNGKDIPSISDGDTVGCGVDFKNKNIFYTLNGERLGTGGEFVDSAVKLFPCVSLSKEGDEIEANFGPIFQYKAANGI